MSSLKRSKKFTRENSVERKLEEAFSDSFGGYVHLGRFVLLIVPNSQRLPRLTSLYFLSFLNGRSNLTALFVDNSQVALNNQPILKDGSFSLASNKLQITLHALFTLVIYPLIFVASTGCPDSTTSYYFLVVWFKWVELIFVLWSGILTQVKFNLFEYQITM